MCGGKVDLNRPLPGIVFGLFMVDPCEFTLIWPQFIISENEYKTHCQVPRIYRMSVGYDFITSPVHLSDSLTRTAHG